jgi:hypothetical protein
MPLSINVGLSRKASKDYQSTGVSINVTAELDQALLAKPDELQKQVGDLYAQAQGALERQAANMSTPEQRRRDDGEERPAHRSARNAGDRGHNGNGNGGGRMTESQHRAISAIADRLDIDARRECRDIIGEELDQLTIRQASELIDHLKGLQPARSSRTSNSR